MRGNQVGNDIQKPSMFYIPIEKKQIVIEKGNEFAVSKNINWISHEVSTGDNLWDLAKKYETKIQIIRDVNQLERDLLSIDQILYSCWESKKYYHTL